MPTIKRTNEISPVKRPIFHNLLFIKTHLLSLPIIIPKEVPRVPMKPEKFVKAEKKLPQLMLSLNEKRAAHTNYMDSPH